MQQFTVVATFTTNEGQQWSLVECQDYLELARIDGGQVRDIAKFTERHEAIKALDAKITKPNGSARTYNDPAHYEEVQVDDQGRVWRSSSLDSALSGTPEFDKNFRALYPTVRVFRDSGKRAADQRAAQIARLGSLG